MKPLLKKSSASGPSNPLLKPALKRAPLVAAGSPRPGRKVLGKGLGALLPAPKFSNHRDDYFLCPVGMITADPDQPRQRFDDEALSELVASIKEKGILQPLVVRSGAAPGTYIVIAGERRLRASRRAGLPTVPVLVKEVASDEAFELALIENIQREDLNPIEEAAAYQRLVQQSTYTQEVLARRLGKKRSTIANSLRLLKLEDPHQQMVIDGEISAGHARCLLAVDDLTARETLAKQMVSDPMTVRQAEAAVRSLKSSGGTSTRRAAASNPTAVQQYCDGLAKELTQLLEAPVSIKARGRRGRLQIAFESIDDLRRLHAQLLSAAGADAETGPELSVVAG